jgi:GNAT superfamily N-acetyltransferase
MHADSSTSATQARLPLTVRFAEAADLAFVSQDGYLSAEIVQRKLTWREVVVAELASQPVGYARLEYLWSQVPYLALIRVLPAHRRQGIGRAIVAFIEAHLREQGHAVWYSSSQVDEPAPQAWHRHLGFEESGLIAGINCGGVGEVFFRKRL